MPSPQSHQPLTPCTSLTESLPGASSDSVASMSLTAPAEEPRRVLRVVNCYVAPRVAIVEPRKTSPVRRTGKLHKKEVQIEREIALKAGTSLTKFQTARHFMQKCNDGSRSVVNRLKNRIEYCWDNLQDYIDPDKGGWHILKTPCSLY